MSKILAFRQQNSLKSAVVFVLCRQIAAKAYNRENDRLGKSIRHQP